MIVRVRVLFITAVNVSSYHGLNKNNSLFDDKILTEDPNKALPEIFQIIKLDIVQKSTKLTHDSRL